MGVGADLYMCDVVVKSSRSLSHLLMSSCILPTGSQNSLKAYIWHSFCRSTTKFGSVRGLANRWTLAQGSSLSAKILKSIKKSCNAFLVHRLAERDEIWHDEGHLCVVGHLFWWTFVRGSCDTMRRYASVLHWCGYFLFHRAVYAVAYSSFVIDCFVNYVTIPSELSCVFVAPLRLM